MNADVPIGRASTTEPGIAKAQAGRALDAGAKAAGARSALEGGFRDSKDTVRLGRTQVRTCRTWKRHATSAMAAYTPTGGGHRQHAPSASSPGPARCHRPNPTSRLGHNRTGCARTPATPLAGHVHANA